VITHGRADWIQTSSAFGTPILIGLSFAAITFPAHAVNRHRAQAGCRLRLMGKMQIEPSGCTAY